jgi:short-subunit dehydrogenase
MLASSTGGTIVTVSSVLGYLTAAGLSDYAATKAAISAVHRTLEAELRLSGDDERVKTLLVETGQMATKLFDDIETPNNFFAPVLEPVHVAREIVSAIDSGTGGVIRLPAFVALVGWYGVLPAGIQRILRSLSGIDRAVGKEAFTKVSDMVGQRVLSSTRSSESDVELVDVDK